MALDVPELQPSAAGAPRMRRGPAIIGASIGVFLALGALALALLLKGTVEPATAPQLVVPTITLPPSTLAPTATDAPVDAPASLPPETTAAP